MYRAPSGALRVRRRHRAVVVGPRRLATRTATPADRNMQQATVNLFADMGVQPATLHRPGSPPRRSRPTRPRRPRRSRRRRASVTDGTQVDAHRHRDRRRRRRRRRRRGLDRRRHAPGTRRPARRAGPTRGSRTAARSTTIKVAGGRRQRQPRRRPAPASTVNVTCPCSIWGTSTVPAARRRLRRPDAGRGRRQVQVRQLRHDHRHPLLQGAANTGTHIGSLWTADGQRLAQATFTGETRLRLADGDVRHARSRSAEHDLRRVLLRAQRPLLGHGRLLLPQPRARARTAARIADSPPLHAHPQHRHGTTNGVYAYGADEHVPDQLLRRRQLLGRRRSSRRRRRPAQVDRRERRRGRHARRRTSPGRAGDRRRRRRSYKITPYIGATAQTPTTVTGSPPATTTTITGLTTARPTRFTRAGGQPDRLGPGVRAVQRRDAARPGRAVGADGRRRAGRPSQSAQVDLDGAGQRRRQPDHRLHGHAVHRRDRADARAGRRVGDERDGHRPHQRHGLHVQGHRDQRRRHRAPRRPPRTPSTPQATIFDFAHAGDRRLGRHRARSSSASSSRPTPTARSPASASTRRRPTPARTSAACGRPPARGSRRSTFTDETRLRLADGRRSPAR